MTCGQRSYNITHQKRQACRVWACCRRVAQALPVEPLTEHKPRKSRRTLVQMGKTATACAAGTATMAGWMQREGPQIMQRIAGGKGSRMKTRHTCYSVQGGRTVAGERSRDANEHHRRARHSQASDAVACWG